MSKSIEPTDEEDVAIGMTRATGVKMRLATGLGDPLTDEDLVHLYETNAIGFCLAANLWNATEIEGAKGALKKTEQTFMAAADALFNVGERHMTKGRWIATASELAAISASLERTTELIRLATKGIFLTSMKQAAEMVSKRLREQNLQNLRKQR